MLPCLSHPDLYCSVSSAFPLCFLHLLQCSASDTGNFVSVQFTHITLLIRQTQNCPSYSFKVREEEEIIIRFYALQAYDTIHTHICKASSQRIVYWRSSDDPGKERGIFSDDDAK